MNINRKELIEKMQALLEQLKTEDLIQASQQAPVKEPMTWERAMGMMKGTWYPLLRGGIKYDGDDAIFTRHTSVPTEAAAKSVAAYCKLLTIIAAYNLGREKGAIVYSVVEKTDTSELIIY